MACIFKTVLLEISAAMTDSFEGRGAYSRGGGKGDPGEGRHHMKDPYMVRPAGRKYRTRHTRAHGRDS